MKKAQQPVKPRGLVFDEDVGGMRGGVSIVCGKPVMWVQTGGVWDVASPDESRAILEAWAMRLFLGIESILKWLDDHAAAAEKEAEQHPDLFRAQLCEGKAVAFRGASAVFNKRWRM